MFIQTETTPNPATLKFLPGEVVVGDGTEEFKDAQDAADRSPLAARLFDVPGVTGVFFGYDFVTVTKDEATAWQHIKPAILGAIMEHFMSNEPVMAASAGQAPSAVDGEEFFDKADAPLVEQIKELLDTRVRPAVAQDGGDITFRGFRDGVVYLNMKGACAGCPSSTATLKHGIQNLLRHFVPEVEQVEQVVV
ncbi:NifU family protein [Notoacmeibacter ruber]|uniref:NifU family protein n=1 Tax=Notoacmeibacter ruber TaxID=2670375 RepID=A0A3L7J8C8_9HYPH|nr:NifU family protein [Notoacmeibacter ruber]RLQ86876.1 NifU family protein [Notoacmeibacter ruber]